MKKILYFITVYCLLKAHCGQGPELYFQHLTNDTLPVSENKFVNLTFWLNTAEYKDPSGDYRMEVETRKIDGSKEYDGKLARINNLCSVTYKKSVRCTGDFGPAELFRKVNRSHAEITVIWRWKDDVSGLLTEKKRTIICNLRCQRRNSKAKHDREEKTKNGRMLKPEILWNLPYKQMSKDQNNYILCTETSLLTVKANEKVPHDNQMLIQEDLLRSLHLKTKRGISTVYKSKV